jgi:tetratricopeptide (TPR) repeat protein
MGRRIFPASWLLVVGACGGSPAPAPDPPPAPERSAAELFEQAEALFRSHETLRALEAYQLVASEAQRQGDRGVATEACAQVARCYSIRGELHLGQMWLDRALERATPGDPGGWVRTEQVRGIYLRERGEREAAVETFVDLYDYCRARGLTSQAIDAAHHVALVAEPAVQVEWAAKGLAAAQAAGDERWQAILWNNLGRTHEALEQPFEALEAYRKARHFHRRTGDEQQVLVADWAVGRGLRLCGRWVEAESLLGEVLSRARRRQSAQPRPGNLEWVGYSLWELGEVAAGRQARDEALERLLQALEVLTGAGLEAVWPEGLEQLRSRIIELETAR